MATIGRVLTPVEQVAGALSEFMLAHLANADLKASADSFYSLIETARMSSKDPQEQQLFLELELVITKLDEKLTYGR